MIDRLAFQTGIKGGDSVPFQLSRGHINGLMIVQTDGVPLSAPLVDYSLTLRRRSQRGSRVLVSSTSLSKLNAISGASGGLEHNAGGLAQLLDGVGVQLDTLFTGVDAGHTVNAVRSSVAEAWHKHFGPSGAVSVTYVDLGSLHLGNGSEFEGHLTRMGTDNGNFATMAVYGVSHRRAPDEMYVYDVALEKDVSHSMLVDAFLMHRDVSEHAVFDSEASIEAATGLYGVPDVMIQVDTEDGSYVSDMWGILAGQAVRGKHEMGLPFGGYALYASDGVPSAAGVRLKISGADADDFEILARRVEYERSATSRSTLRNATRLRERIENIERTDRETAKAMRHAGRISKSSEIRRAEAVGRASLEQDSTGSDEG